MRVKHRFLPKHFLVFFHSITSQSWKMILFGCRFVILSFMIYQILFKNPSKTRHWQQLVTPDEHALLFPCTRMEWSWRGTFHGFCSPWTLSLSCTTNTEVAAKAKGSRLRCSATGLEMYAYKRRGETLVILKNLDIALETTIGRDCWKCRTNEFYSKFSTYDSLGTDQASKESNVD